MANTPIDPVVEMKIGGEWVDVTDKTRLSSADSGGGITITRGVPNEGTQAEPTQLDLTLNNAEGVFSPKNPNGPYYGLLGRNQPIRVGLNRIYDDFDRTTDGALGFTPDKDLGNGLTKPGRPFAIIGSEDRWSINGGSAEYAATTGVGAALVGQYGDCDVLVKVKTSNLDTSFGVMFRAFAFDLTPISRWFDDGVGGWTATGGSVQQTTAVLWNGHPSAVLLVSGTPASSSVKTGAAARVPVVEGLDYRAKMWVRSPGTPDVQAEIDWYDSDGNLISTSSGSEETLVADTWEYLEVQDTAPAGAVAAAYGATLPDNPSNGTQLVVNDLSFHDYNELSWFVARANPALSTDALQLQIVLPGHSLSYSTDLPEAVVADTWYWLRAQVERSVVAVKFWADGDDEPHDWQVWSDLAADERPSESPVQVPKVGPVGLYAVGGTATVSFDSLQIDDWRAHAEISELPVRFDLSRNDRWVPIQARGVTRRLGQGRKTLDPAITQHLRQYVDRSASWWPLNDGSEAEIAGNYVPGGKPGFIKNVTFGADDELVGADGVMTLAEEGAQFHGRIKEHAHTGEFSILFFFRLPALPAATMQLAQVFIDRPSPRRFLFEIETDGDLRVRAQSITGTVLDETLNAFIGFQELQLNTWIAMNLNVQQNGGDIDWEWNARPLGSTTTYSVSSSFSGTLARAFSMFFGWYDTNLINAGGVKYAHAMHTDELIDINTYDFYKAMDAYVGETTDDRARRLMSSSGIRYRSHGHWDGGTAMGPQRPATLLDHLDDIATVEHGMVIESKMDFGLVLLARRSLYIQTPVELDIDAGHVSPPLEPVADDQQTRNSVMVTRPGGSSATSVQTEGPLNINEPELDPDGVGLYDESAEVNAATDVQLQPMANWRRSKGTQDVERYPSITAELVSSAYQEDEALTIEVANLDTGRLIELDNPEVTPDPAEQLIYGYVEKIDQYEWSMTFNTLPGGLYRVGVLGQTTRLDTSNFVTEDDFVAGTDTSLFIERIDTDGKRWVRPEDQAAAFPMDVMVSGVRLRVTDVDGTGTIQTMTVEQTPINGVTKTIPAGAAVKVYRPWRMAL